MNPSPDPIARAGELLAQLRARRPRVHAITNTAAGVLTANLLLAVGAIPSLTTSAEEAPAFTARADALVINLGTLDTERRAAIPWCIATARSAGKPWVLDPVFVEASPPRLAIARLALTGRPTLVRCNAAEGEALMGEAPTPETLAGFARAHGTAVALTGPTDIVADGGRLARIDNGHPLMSRVTAMGCAGTTLIAAFAALEPDPWLAATCGLLVLGVAGEIAGAAARGPGSFPAAYLDALDALEPAMIGERARLS